MRECQLFLEIVRRFTDERWGKVREDLILKSLKVLRAYEEGKRPEELSPKLTEGLGDFHLRLYEVYREADAKRLTEALSHFLKSPAPCKLSTISLLGKLIDG